MVLISPTGGIIVTREDIFKRGGGGAERKPIKREKAEQKTGEKNAKNVQDEKRPHFCFLKCELSKQLTSVTSYTQTRFTFWLCGKVVEPHLMRWLKCARH